MVVYLVPKSKVFHRVDASDEALRTERRAKRKCRERVLMLGADHLLTLTYRDNLESLPVSKHHIRQFIDRVRETVPQWKLVAAAERQKRGAIHWHCAVKGYQNVQLLRALWQRVIWPYEGNIDVKRFEGRSSTDIGRYIAKYIGKGFGDERPRYGHHYVTSRGLTVEEVFSFRSCYDAAEIQAWVVELLLSMGASSYALWVAENALSAGGRSW